MKKKIDSFKFWRWDPLEDNKKNPVSRNTSEWWKGQPTCFTTVLTANQLFRDYTII